MSSIGGVKRENLRHSGIKISQMVDLQRQPFSPLGRIISKEFSQSISQWWFLPWRPMYLVQVSLSELITLHYLYWGYPSHHNCEHLKTTSTKYLCSSHCFSLCINPLNHKTFLKGYEVFTVNVALRMASEPLLK